MIYLEEVDILPEKKDLNRAQMLSCSSAYAISYMYDKKLKSLVLKALKVKSRVAVDTFSKTGVGEEEIFILDKKEKEDPVKQAINCLSGRSIVSEVLEEIKNREPPCLLFKRETFLY